MAIPQNINQEWIPIFVKIIDLIESENLFDREKIAILLIVASYYINRAAMRKKDAQQLIGWAMNTYFANTPVEQFKDIKNESNSDSSTKVQSGRMHRKG